MLTVSLALNVLAIWRDGPKVTVAFGPDGPARRILASIYAAILIVSLAGLALLLQGPLSPGLQGALLGLLAVQIIYKLTTIATVGLRNPVVISNTLITAVHCATVYVTLG